MQYNKIMIIILQKAFLFDFTDPDGNNVIQVWADELPLQKRTRAKIESKIDMLAKAGDDLPPKLFATSYDARISWK